MQIILHVQKKKSEEIKMERDEYEAIENKTCHVIAMDVQAKRVFPSLNASALYYRTKLNCHIFTVYDLAIHYVTCYWFNELQADLSACTFPAALPIISGRLFLKILAKL